MRRVRAFRAQTHIVLWTFACILPMLAGALFATWRLADAQGAADRRQILQTAHGLSAAVDLKLEKGLAALSALGTSPALADGRFAAFYDQCAAVARQHGAAIVLIDSGNQPIFNTAQPFGTKLPPLHHDRAREALVSGRPLVSGVFYSQTLHRLEVSTYIPVEAATRRYTLLMVLSTDEIERILAAQNSPPSWIVSVADRDGHILARTRFLDRFADKLVGPKLLARMQSGMDGAYYGVNREGTQVLAAFAKSPVSGWSVVVGIPLTEINAPLVKSVATTVAVTLLLLALGAAGAGLVGRRLAHWLRALREAATAAADGEAPPPLRSSIAEVNELAGSLAAAGALAERRSRDLARQTATLATLVDNMPIAVSLVGADQRYLAFNHLFLEQMGLKRDDLRVGDPLAKFVRHLAVAGDYGPGDVDAHVRARLARTPLSAAEQFETTRDNGPHPRRAYHAVARRRFHHHAHRRDRAAPARARDRAGARAAGAPRR